MYLQLSNEWSVLFQRKTIYVRTFHRALFWFHSFSPKVSKYHNRNWPISNSRQLPNFTTYTYNMEQELAKWSNSNSRKYIHTYIYIYIYIYIQFASETFTLRLSNWIVFKLVTSRVEFCAFEYNNPRAFQNTETSKFLYMFLIVKMKNQVVSSRRRLASHRRLVFFSECFFNFLPLLQLQFTYNDSFFIWTSSVGQNRIYLI